jgi:hypothetical protein
VRSIVTARPACHAYQGSTTQVKSFEGWLDSHE